MAVRGSIKVAAWERDLLERYERGEARQDTAVAMGKSVNTLDTALKRWRQAGAIPKLRSAGAQVDWGVFELVSRTGRMPPRPPSTVGAQDADGETSLRGEDDGKEGSKESSLPGEVDNVGSDKETTCQGKDGSEDVGKAATCQGKDGGKEEGKKATCRGEDVGKTTTCRCAGVSDETWAALLRVAARELAQGHLQDYAGGRQVVVNCKIPERLHTAVQEWCRSHRVDMSSIIRQALVAAVTGSDGP